MRREERALKELGKRIKELRAQLQLRQEDLEEFGISVKHYQDIEAGRVNPTYMTLLKLAKAFKCSLKDIVP